MEAGIHELTAGYALDALDEGERREYEAHLAECESCRAELSSFWRTSEALAVAAAGPEPSPDLRDRIVSAARAEPRVVVPFEPRRRRRVSPALGAVAAIAALVALALGLWALQLSSDLDDTRSALEQERAAAAVVADPEARTVSLAEGQGRLVVTEDGRAALVLDGLGPAPDGKTYALWIIEDDTPAPAGLFPGSEGLELVALDGTVDQGDVVAVTVEDGPVQAPSSEPVVASEPA
jgi:anti-sigma-K factor RskA